MFWNKTKDKKESNSSGSTSTYKEMTRESNNGTTVIRQVSQETRSYFRQETSSGLSISKSTGSVPSMLSPNRRISSPFVTEFGGGGGNRLNSINADFGKLSIKHDAVPFSSSINRTPIVSSSYAAHRPSSYISSYPSGTSSLRSTNPAVLSTLQTQSAAWNPATSQSETVIPTYKHQNAKLGKALIINNIKFMKKEEERLGAKKDSADLERLLKKIGFEVEHKPNLKAREISEKVKKFSRSSFSYHDIALVVVMSHGNNLAKSGGELMEMRGGYTSILGCDNELVATDDLIDHFTSGTCHPTLKGKPKIFIFQCCRGKQDQEVAHDAATVRQQKKQYADVLIAFSTLPDYVSNRNPKTGSWYIQSICEVFEKHHHDSHIEDMLKIVDHQLANKHPLFTQTSTYENRGFKRCYLHKNIP